MRKIRPLFFLSVLTLFSFTACKNFMNGGELLEQLEESLDFFSAPYLTVTIAADNQATQSINPAVGTYDAKYKKTSRINLSFDETENFQFTNWVVEPEGAVTFEDETAKSTIATIQTDEAELKIYPRVYKRPEISVSPSNLLVSPKNTSTVITFDHKMEINDELLNSIDIQLDNLSVLSNYKAPVVSDVDGKTTITFTPDRSKLVNLENSTAKVDVIIPEGFCYKTSDGYDILLNKQVIYTYKINNETLDKAKITFSASATEGELSFAENLSYSLDQEISSTFTPTQEYFITGWKIVYENGEEVDPSIISKTVSADKYTVTVKLLTGSERQITVKPVCEKRKAATITFEATHGSTSISGQKKYFAGDVFTVNYTETTDYAFTGWSVYSKGTVIPSATLAQILSIDDATKKEIKITVKELTQDYDLQLKAENLPRPTIEISPKNIVTVAKNTAVSIDFKRKMEISAEQLASIDIQISNLSILKNFNAPEKTEVDGNTVITFIPKRSNLITLEAATATVNVIIPAGFYYLSPSGQKIATIEKTVYAYKINNETLDKATITVSSSQGTLSYSGTKDYFLDDEITVSFTPSQEYEVTDWKAYYADNTEVSPNIIRITPSADKKTVTAKLLTGSDKSFTLKPVCKDCNYIQAYFIADHGYISPAEPKKIYSGKTQTLTYRQDTDFSFLNWTILNAVDNTPVSPEAFASLFDIDETSLETEIKVKELSQNYSLKFVATCAERAQILSTTPVYLTEGTYRDAKIQVMFDHDMSEESIYYTSTEITSIKNEKNITDDEFLKTGSLETGFKYYGYQINNEIFYKNISIINYKTHENLLKHFGIPFFDSSTVLVIPTLKDNPPPSGTQVFVTIDSNVCYYENSKPITLAGTKKWNYLVNSKIDSDAPYLSITLKTDDDKNTNTDDNYLIFHEEGLSGTSVPSKAQALGKELSYFFSRPDKLQLALSLTDTASGPSSITMVVTNYGSIIKEQEVELKLKDSVSELYFGTKTASNIAPEDFDLTSLVNIPLEGTNIIQFIGKDKNDNKVYSDYYYFYSDTTPPNYTPANCPNAETDDSTISLSWANPSDSDFDHIKLEYCKRGDSNNKVTIEDLNSTHYEIAGLDRGSTYDFYCTAYDIWDNSSTTLEFSKNTAPNRPSFTTTLPETFTNSNISLEWTPPEGNYSGAYICYSEQSSDKEPVTKYSEINNSETLQYNISSLTFGKQYKIQIYSLDSEGNKSAEYDELSTILLPRIPYGLNISNITTASAKLAWSRSSTYADGYKLEYKKQEDSDWTTKINTTSASAFQYSLTNLSSGTPYVAKVTFFTNVDIDGTSTPYFGTPAQTTFNTQTASIQAFKTTNVTPTSISIEWQNNNENTYDKLKLKYNSIPASTAKTIELEKGTTSYTISNLVPGTDYSISLCAILNNVAGESTELSSGTLPCPLSNFVTDTTNSTSIKLTLSLPITGKYDNTRIYYSTSSSITDSTSYVTLDKTTTTYTFSNLKSGTKYYFEAKTVVGEDQRLSSGKTLYAVTKPSAVTRLSTSETVNSSSSSKRNITVSWKAPSSSSGNYDSVRVYYGTSNNPSTDYVSVQKASHDSDGYGSYTFTGLTAGTTYYYNVVSTITDNSALISSASYQTSKTTSPNALRTFTATTDSSTGITLSWSAPSYGNYSGVSIYKSTSSSGTYSLLTTVSGSTSYTDTNCKTGTYYYYKAVAYASSTSNVSSEKSSYAPTKSAAVTNVTISNYNSTYYKISWSAPSTGSYTGVFIYYKLTSASSWTQAAQTTSSLYYLDKSKLTPGQKYDIQIISYLGTTSNTGTPASTTLNVPPEAVTGLKVSDLGTNKLTLSWTGVSSYKEKYEVYYKKTTESSYTYATYVTGTSYTFQPKLSSGTKYNFKVRTVGYTSSNYLDSEVLTYHTLPSAPTNFSVYCDDGQGRIRLRWEQPSGDAFDDVDLYLDSSRMATIYNSSYSAGSYAYYYLDIPNFSRSSSYTITLKPYIKQYDNNYATGDEYTYTYFNTSGNLTINGTSYSYTCLKNVITSSATISANTTLTDGAFTKNRNVTLSPYSIGAYEVTNELYKAVTGTIPSSSNTSNYYPVQNMNWYQACWFCNKLSYIMGLTPVYEISGKDIAYYYTYSSVPTDTTSAWSKMTYNMSADGYRLPTEAEWEFAARGGSTTDNAWSYQYAGSNTRDNVAWSNSNAGGKTHPVGQKYPNRLGLYDMSGNVWEWLTDWNNNVPNGTFKDPYIPYSSSYKSQDEVLQKGGSWNNDTNCKVDFNSTHETPGTEDDRTGFRIMRRKTCTQ